MIRPALVLTGEPAAGKSTTGMRLAQTTERAAFIDVDDLRQLVKNGGAAPWDGDEGVTQQMLGVRNAAQLTTAFLRADFNVIVADVITPYTLRLYRELLPGAVVVRLAIRLQEARRRALSRPAYLTEHEFDSLHRDQVEGLLVDHDIDVSDLGLAEQVEAVRRLWKG